VGLEGGRLGEGREIAEEGELAGRIGLAESLQEEAAEEARENADG